MLKKIIFLSLVVLSFFAVAGYAAYTVYQNQVNPAQNISVTKPKEPQLIEETSTINQEQGIKISKNGNLIGKVACLKMTEKGCEKHDFKLMRRDLALLWTTDSIHTDVLFLSEANGGTVVERVCGEGGCNNQIKIFNKENLKGRTITTSLGPGSSDMESTGGDISEDGNYFAVTYESIGGQHLIAYFDINGNQLWTYDMKDAFGNEVGISPDGNFLVMTIHTENPRENNIYFFNKKGQILLKHATGYIGDYHFVFSNDEKKVAIGSSNGELYLFDTTSLRLQWQYSADSKGFGFTDLDVRNDGAIVTTATIINPEDLSVTTVPRYICLFDSSGAMVLVKLITNHGFKDWREGPTVKFDENTGDILVTLKNKIQRYSL